MKNYQTKTRNQLTRLLKAEVEPISLEGMHNLLKHYESGLAFSTVYRLAKKLEAEGKVIRVDWRERGSRFEWADREHHHHIVCERCGKTVDVQADCFEINEGAITVETGFTLVTHNIELEGVCVDCQKTNPNA